MCIEQAENRAFGKICVPEMNWYQVSGEFA